MRRRAVGSIALVLALALALVAVLTVATDASRAASPEPADPTPSGSGRTDPWHHVDEAGVVRVDLWFAWSSTCPHCLRAIPLVQQLDEELEWLDVHSLQVDGARRDEAIATLLALADLAGDQVSGVPAFLYGGRLVTGYDAPETTGASLRAGLIAYRESIVGPVTPTPAPTSAPGPTSAPVPTTPPDTSIVVPVIGAIDARTISLPVLAVVLGSLDAVNPCALSVLLFLLSVLAGARQRMRIALVGGVFVLISGLVYFVLMAAWLNIFLLVGALRVVTVIAGLAAITAALINLKDFAWFGRGPSLVIPRSARPAIFGRLMNVSETTAFAAILGTAVLAAAVANVYEMLCTGGFPVVFTRILTLNELPLAAYYGYLALYATVYVVPLLVVVAFATWRLGSRSVKEIEARRLKLLSGLLMFGFGIILLVDPDRLTDMGTALLLFGGAIAIWIGALVLTRGRLGDVPASEPAGGTGRRTRRR